MTGRLEGKVAIVTGGASGIGRATVEMFVREGARVVIADFKPELGEAVAAGLGDAASFIEVDVGSDDQVKAMVDHAVERFGALHVLFNNAGIPGVSGELPETDMSGFGHTVDVLLRGVVSGYKHAAPIMIEQKSGSIISTASVAGLQAGFGPHLYSALKAGVAHLARTAALELGPHFVRSNAICPGGIATSIFGAAIGLGDNAAAEFGEFVKQRLSGIQPVPRAGVPDDIAHLALFLASDESTFLTGQAIAVDGGITAGPMRGLTERLEWEETVARFLAEADQAGS